MESKKLKKREKQINRQVGKKQYKESDKKVSKV
jgi:hypothetical protein